MSDLLEETLKIEKSRPDNSKAAEIDQRKKPKRKTWQMSTAVVEILVYTRAFSLKSEI